MIFNLHHSKKQSQSDVDSDPSRRQNAKAAFKKLGSKVKHSFKKILGRSESSKTEPITGRFHNNQNRHNVHRAEIDLDIIGQHKRYQRSRRRTVEMAADLHVIEMAPEPSTFAPGSSAKLYKREDVESTDKNEDVESIIVENQDVESVIVKNEDVEPISAKTEDVESITDIFFGLESDESSYSSLSEDSSPQSAALYEHREGLENNSINKLAFQPHAFFDIDLARQEVNNPITVPEECPGENLPAHSGSLYTILEEDETSSVRSHESSSSKQSSSSSVYSTTSESPQVEESRSQFTSIAKLNDDTFFKAGLVSTRSASLFTTCEEDEFETWSISSSESSSFASSLASSEAPPAKENKVQCPVLLSSQERREEMIDAPSPSGVSTSGGPAEPKGIKKDTYLSKANGIGSSLKHAHKFDEHYSYVDIPTSTRERQQSVFRSLISAAQACERSLSVNSQIMSANLKKLTPYGAYLRPLQYSKEALESFFDRFMVEAKSAEFLPTSANIPLIIWQFEEAYSVIDKVFDYCSYRWCEYESIYENKVGELINHFLKQSDISRRSICAFAEEVYEEMEHSYTGAVLSKSKLSGLDGTIHGLMSLFIMLDGNAKIMKNNHIIIAGSATEGKVSGLKKLRYNQEDFREVWCMLDECIPCLEISEEEIAAFDSLRKQYKYAYNRVPEILELLFGAGEDSKVTSVYAKSLVFHFTRMSESLSKDTKQYWHIMQQRKQAVSSKKESIIFQT